MPRRIVAGLAVLVVAVAVAGIWLVAGGGTTPAKTGPVPRFVDETATSGLAHTYDGDFAFVTGGGVATFDCNDDGRPDLYIAGGARPAELFVNESPVGGGLRFSPRHDPVTDLQSVNGAYPVDIDGDGHVDLAVLRNGGNVLLRGRGDCRFDDATTAWALDPGKRHTEAFSATWEPGSTWPTLAFGNYVDPVVYDDPTTLDPAAWCEPNTLVRLAPAGGGFGPALALTPSWCTLSMLFSDWSGSGRADLRVSNDAHYYRAIDGEEQLWRIPPSGTPSLYGPADGWVRVQVQGMGIASYDVTGDGLPEVYLTSQGANRLQTLTAGASQPIYSDIGAKRGVNASQPFAGADQKLPSTAWHPEFEDVNNDGLIDLFVSKGNVTSQPDYAMQDPSNLLLGQPDGTFLEAADQAGIVTFDRGRGAALADFNLDGRLDLVEVFYGAPVRVWRNAGPVGSDAASSTAAVAHWLSIRIVQPAPNIDAIGAHVEVKVNGVITRREVTIGGGHAGGELGPMHIGLGAAKQAQVRVTWPDGSVGPWLDVGADLFVVVTRGAPVIGVWEPPP